MVIALNDKTESFRGGENLPRKQKLQDIKADGSIIEE